MKKILSSNSSRDWACYRTPLLPDRTGKEKSRRLVGRTCARRLFKHIGLFTVLVFMTKLLSIPGIACARRPIKKHIIKRAPICHCCVFRLVRVGKLYSLQPHWPGTYYDRSKSTYSAKDAVSLMLIGNLAGPFFCSMA